MTPRPPRDRPGRPLRDRPGLAAERTRLSWERTAAGLFATALLLLFRHVEPITPGRGVLLGAYLAVGLLAVVLGFRRSRLIRAARPRAGQSLPVMRSGLVLLGSAVVGLAAATAVVVAIPA